MLFPKLDLLSKIIFFVLRMLNCPVLLNFLKISFAVDNLMLSLLDIFVNPKPLFRTKSTKDYLFYYEDYCTFNEIFAYLRFEWEESPLKAIFELDIIIYFNEMEMWYIYLIRMLFLWSDIHDYLEPKLE